MSGASGARGASGGTAAEGREATRRSRRAERRRRGAEGRRRRARGRGTAREGEPRRAGRERAREGHRRNGRDRSEARSARRWRGRRASVYPREAMEVEPLVSTTTRAQAQIDQPVAAAGPARGHGDRTSAAALSTTSRGSRGIIGFASPRPRSSAHAERARARRRSRLVFAPRGSSRRRRDVGPDPGGDVVARQLQELRGEGGDAGEADAERGRHEDELRDRGERAGVRAATRERRGYARGPAAAAAAAAETGPSLLLRTGGLLRPRRFVRLPVASAKKLRLLDKVDVGPAGRTPRSAPRSSRRTTSRARSRESTSRTRRRSTRPARRRR